MIKTIILFTLAISFNSMAQKPALEDFSGESSMNYTFARIYPKEIFTKTLYNGGMFVTIYKLSDSKATPNEFSLETEEFLDSYIISVVPDGDYYTNSKLYKIKGVYDPKILEITERKYPDFSIKIEYGSYLKKRKIKSFKIQGVE